MDYDTLNQLRAEDMKVRAWEKEESLKLTGENSLYLTFDRKMARKAYIFPQVTYSEEINSMVF